MRINVQFDSAQLQTRSPREQRRLAYNVTNSLNNVGKKAQKRIRDHITQVMKLRSSTKRDRKWILERIKLKFASIRKEVIYCEIYVDKKARLLLGAFETGEQREAFVGKNIAIPNPSQARQGGQFGGQIKPELTYKALRMKPVRVTARTRPDTEQFKGADRTFTLKSTAKHPLGGTFQRVGPGPDDIRLVYSAHRAFKLREILDFVKTAAESMNDDFAVEWVIANARNPPAK